MFKCLDLHCLTQKTVTQSDKGLAKIVEGAFPRRHAETSPVKVRDTHLMNNRLPPSEILCRDWVFSTAARTSQSHVTAINMQRSSSGYQSIYDVTPFLVHGVDTNFPSQLDWYFMRRTTQKWVGFRITYIPLTIRIYKKQVGDYFARMRPVSHDISLHSKSVVNKALNIWKTKKINTYMSTNVWTVKNVSTQQISRSVRCMILQSRTIALHWSFLYYKQSMISCHVPNCQGGMSGHRWSAVFLI